MTAEPMGINTIIIDSFKNYKQEKWSSTWSDVRADKIMSNKSVELIFTNLLTKALLDWPKIINVDELIINYQNDEKYAAKGLVEKLELTEKIYFKKEKVLMRNIYCAIYQSIYAAAKFSSVIKFSLLRKKTIEVFFKSKLIANTPIKDYAGMGTILI